MSDEHTILTRLLVTEGCKNLDKLMDIRSVLNGRLFYPHTIASLR